MNESNPQPQTQGRNRVLFSDLLAAADTLAALSRQMAEEYQNGGSSWPRDWMQKHVNDRAALLKAREVLTSRIEAESQKPCVDQGDGFWDCSKFQRCMKPQCDDCPQKAANVAR